MKKLLVSILALSALSSLYSSEADNEWFDIRDGKATLSAEYLRKREEWIKRKEERGVKAAADRGGLLRDAIGNSEADGLWSLVVNGCKPLKEKKPTRKSREKRAAIAKRLRREEIDCENRDILLRVICDESHKKAVEFEGFVRHLSKYHKETGGSMNEPKTYERPGHYNVTFDPRDGGSISVRIKDREVIARDFVNK
jgi:hypothetical protein